MAKKDEEEKSVSESKVANIAKPIPKAYKSTAEIEVSKNLIGQILGQETAVEIIKKSAGQRRNVLLIGEPGTGKSMLGLALAELLPKEKLADIIAFPNPNDENTPLIRTVPAGQGRELVARARIQGMSMFKNQNIIMFIIFLLAMFSPWWSWAYYSKYGNTVAAIMTAAVLIFSVITLIGIMLSLNLNKRMEGRVRTPKVIVDNYKKKQAPFYDATGAHAGALLGDVLHDPFQSLRGSNKISIIDEKGDKKTATMSEVIEKLFTAHIDKISRKKEKNYEAVHIPTNGLRILGETNGSIAIVEVLSANRYDHDGKMIKLTTSANKELIVTPEHKIAVWENGKIAYKEARDIKEDTEVVSEAEDIIIDEQDIVNTYDERQQEQCRLYHQYIDIKAQNPSWGYKRIAKAMGQNIGKTRWWHAKKHIPVPIQTANWLKEKGLLPLNINSPKLPLISKVLGATFGDGGIFENLNGIFLSSSEKEAVEEFGNDLKRIFNFGENQNSRIIEGGVYGHSWCYQNTNRNIIRFFLALGAPKGNKTHIELKIPEWIPLNENLEEEFYGSILGGELGTPIIHKTGNHLTNLELGITGNEKLDKNRYDFLSKISSYLIKRNVVSTSIYKRKLNENSIIYRLQISKKFDNISYFMINIKINYCNYKVERLYKALGQWTKLKKEKYYELLQRGYGAESAMNLLNLTPNSLYLILNHFGPKQEATA